MKRTDISRLLEEIGLQCHYSKSVFIEMDNEVEDFEIGGYRFIHSDYIFSVLEQELLSDLYLLGCFKASFLADVTGLPEEMIIACQEQGAYEAIGNGVIGTDSICRLAQEYINSDGFGHHFAHYDHITHQVEAFYVFRVS